MRPLRYSINVTLDGCVDHRVGTSDPDVHRRIVANFERSDALLFGRVTYEMMEEGWRHPAEEMPEWMAPFAKQINDAKKYVVSSTLDRADWNAEILRGDLKSAVEKLKESDGKGLYVGGVTLPLALANWGLIDEFEFYVQPTIAGHGPTLFAGLRERLGLKLVGREEFASGTVALRYEPTNER